MATFIEVHEEDSDGEAGAVHYVNADHIVKFYNPGVDGVDGPTGTLILFSVDMRRTTNNCWAVDPKEDSPNTMLVHESVQLIRDRIRNASRRDT